jgi:hypothetical protein
MSRSPSNVSPGAYILLGMMSLVCFGGPFALALLLSGGERSGWPPDRTVEWVGAIGLLVLFTILFAACLTIRLWLIKPSPPKRPDDDLQAGA